VKLEHAAAKVDRRRPPTAATANRMREGGISPVLVLVLVMVLVLTFNRQVSRAGALR